MIWLFLVGYALIGLAIGRVVLLNDTRTIATPIIVGALWPMALLATLVIWLYFILLVD